MNKIIISIIILCIFSFNCSNKTTNIATGTYPELPKGKSPYWGLTHFLNTDFMIHFEEARQRAEESVKDFKRMQNEFLEDDVLVVIAAYNASANKFNNILYKIKDDLLNKNMRQVIINNPHTYASALENDLNLAKDFYANNYQKEVTRITNGSITGAAFIALLPEIIKYAKLAFDMFKKINAEIKKYNDKLLEKYLIEPYRFHSWDELG